MTNILHNFSFAVDTWNDVETFFTSEAKGQGFDGPYDAGFGIGRLVSYIVADNELAA